MKRIYNLDYLRGLAAFSIMVYHYLSWALEKFAADTFLGRIGVYGVSMFYILSGLTLYYVYYDKMKPSRNDVLLFVKKRIFRIFPLLWLVTILSIIIKKENPNLYDLFLNLTGLFGFIKWDVYFSAGVWSIGNELVFYALFPLFVLFTKSAKFLLSVLILSIFLLYIYFAFWVLDSELTINEQWDIYTNPLNQIFLFLGGYLIGLFFSNIKLTNSISITLLLLGTGVFIFYPAEGNTINLVTGVNRLVFTFCCFIICVAFYKLSIKLPNLIHKPLTLLGEASYSVYLLHPIVFSITGTVLSISGKYLFHLPESVRLILSVITTLILSYFVYTYFEKYFIKKAVTTKIYTV